MNNMFGGGDIESSLWRKIRSLVWDRILDVLLVILVEMLNKQFSDRVLEIQLRISVGNHQFTGGI